MHEMNAIGDFVACGVASRDFERWRGNVGRKYFGVRQFPCQRNGQAAGARADVCHAQSFAGRSGIHVNFYSAFAQTRERDFHYVLGFRPGNQHGGRDFEFQTPEFLFAGEILHRLPCGAARNQR